MLQPWKNPNRSKYVFPWRCSCLLLHLPRKRDLLLWICCVTDERTWQIERCHVQGKESNRIFFQLPKKSLWQQFLKGMNVKIFYPSSRKKRHFKMRASAKNLARLVFYWTCASYYVTPWAKIPKLSHYFFSNFEFIMKCKWYFSCDFCSLCDGMAPR